MGWIDKKHVECLCPARPDPARERFGRGSVWQCDDCGQEWMYFVNRWMRTPVLAADPPIETR
jgi:ribosomal protein L37AE/L43A